MQAPRGQLFAAALGLLARGFLGPLAIVAQALYRRGFCIGGVSGANRCGV